MNKWAVSLARQWAGHTSHQTQWNRSWQGRMLLVCCSCPSLLLRIFCSLLFIDFFFFFPVRSWELHFYFITADLRGLPNTSKKGNLTAVHYILIVFSDRREQCSPCGKPRNHPAVKFGCIFPLFQNTHGLSTVLKHRTASKSNHSQQNPVRGTGLHNHRSVRNLTKCFPHHPD